MFQTDYNIIVKPTISIDGKPLDFEYPVDNNDEITLSDILMSMRASIKVNNKATPNNENSIYIKSEFFQILTISQNNPMEQRHM